PQLRQVHWMEAAECPVGLRADLSFLFQWPEQEQNNVADRLAISQKHDEPIDANAEAAGGWDGVLQGLDEIVVHVGHRVLFWKARQLRAERLFLGDGIV